MAVRWVGVGVLVLAACGPRVVVDADDQGASTNGDTGSEPSTTTGMPGTSTTGVPGTTSTTSGPFTTTDPETSSGVPDDSGFIQLPDFVCSVDPTDGPIASCFGCQFWDQDCPDGEKCTAWANDGGDVFNSERCVPVMPDAARPGEPCSVKGGPYSGVDTCDYASLCWNVDPDTLEGECVAACQGNELNPVCEDESTFCFFALDSYLALCVQPCDPLLPTCADGFGCWPDDNAAWGCLPIGIGLQATNELSPLCAPGSIDVHPDNVSSCDPEADLCCTPLCDVLAPVCDVGLDCVGFYEKGQAPSGLEDVGLCIDV